MSFTNKVVLITGGSSGIGAKTAILFAKEGANVAIVGRNVAKLAKVEEEINKIGNKPLVIVADVSKDDEAITIVTKTVEAFGKLDILVNNAGILRYCEILDANFLQVYDEIMNINMRPVVIITSQAVPYIRETKGNIINISSVAGIDVIQPGFISYQASKAALTHFTKALAVELGPYGVRANIVSPGPVKTDIFESAGMGGFETVMENTTVLNRLSDPEEVADIIAYLANDKAKSVTGSNYVIDNGFILK